MLKFIFLLKNRGIKIFYENEKIKLLMPEGIYITEEEAKILKENRDSVINILIKNNIFTESDSEKTILALSEEEKSETSFSQERLLFIDCYEEGTNAYNIPIVLTLSDKANIECFKNSIESIVKRHEVLRTVFRQDKAGKYYQKVLSSTLKIEELTFSSDMFKLKLQEDIRYKFDLEKSYPIKVTIYHVEMTVRVLINIHHIAFDGWSIHILTRELEAYYNYYHEGAQLNLPELDIQYRDFSIWQREYLKGETLEKQVNYWKKELEGYQTLSMVTDKVRPSEIDYRGKDLSFECKPELIYKIRELAQKNGTTAYTVLLSAFYLLLSKYSGQEDIVIGIPIANRHYAQIENLIGFFVNSLGLRLQINGQENFETLVTRINQKLLEAQRHQDLPFEKLVEVLRIEQDRSRHPIFQVMVVAQAFEQNDKNECSIFKFTESMDDSEIAKFDLSLFINDNGRNISFTINYATSLFYEDTILQLSKQYIHILEQCVDNSVLPILNIQSLTSSERNLILLEWNKTEKEYFQHHTLQGLFEIQVKNSPNTLAIVLNNQGLTYQQLNDKANQLARLILKKYYEVTKENFKPNTLIGIYAERSTEIIIGMLAVLKIGGAYVPIDPEYPAERVDYILRDTQMSIVLVQSHLVNRLTEINNSVLYLPLDKSSWENQDNINLKIENTPKDLAYVIYTSGTTGKPKGVMLEHNSVINYIENLKIKFLPGHKHVDYSSSLSFDLTVTTTLGALLLGHTIYVYDNHLEDISKYIEHLEKNKINFIKTVPALYELISKILPLETSLQEVVLGGEKLNRSNLKYLPSIKVYDEYGPTEATVGALLSTIFPDNQPGIGRAYHNYKLYVLDQHLQPVAVGAIGELYIGGACLARGYLNRPELTQERFIKNPFATAKDQVNGYTRLYKTGDLVRWLADGNLEYRGRNDFQVKLRGFRIELGEIESALIDNFVEIKQCVVLCNDKNGSQYLVAYYVSIDKLQDESIKKCLYKILPNYMVPSVFIHLEALPLTINGKLDSKSLPDPKLNFIEEYVAPKSELEKVLCKIWEEILETKQIGIRSDFFNIGGNSIKSIQVIFMCKQQGIILKPSDIFKYRNIALIAEHCIYENTITSDVNIAQEIIISMHDECDISSKPFYCIHPGGGTVECYLNFAHELKDKYNFYAIRDPMLDIKHKLFSSIEETAEFYIKSIEKSSYREPFILSGWSYGGAVAYEMARQLVRNGKKIESVILIDSWLWSQCDYSYLPESIDEFKEELGDQGNKLPENVLQSIHQVTLQQAKNLKLYKPSSPSFPVLLLKSKSILADTAFAKFDTSYNQWDKYVNSNFRVCQIEGTHAQAMEYPFVKRVAQEILEYQKMATK